MITGFLLLGLWCLRWIRSDSSLLWRDALLPPLALCDISSPACLVVLAVFPQVHHRLETIPVDTGQRQGIPGKVTSSSRGRDRETKSNTHIGPIMLLQPINLTPDAWLCKGGGSQRDSMLTQREHRNSTQRGPMTFCLLTTAPLCCQKNKY